MEFQARKLGAQSPVEDEDRLQPKCASNGQQFVSELGGVDCPNLGSVRREWLCIFTQPNRERLAFGKLSELGFKVYLPFRRKLVLRRGKRVPMKAPLFPRYLFICADKENSNLFSAHRQTGVTGLAGRSFSQSLISDSIIRAIKARESPDGYVGLQSTSIKRGQKVMILDGPFAAIDAIFSESKDELRSILLLSLLGKTHKVVVSNENLQLVA